MGGLVRLKKVIMVQVKPGLGQIGLTKTFFLSKFFICIIRMSKCQI